MSRVLLGIAVGLALAVVSAASPLGVLCLIVAPVLCRVAARGLPPDERRALYLVLGSALAARFLVVATLFLAGLAGDGSLGGAALAGDQGYNLSRSLRARDILAGFGGLTHYDYFVVTDQYGRTSYLDLLTVLQLVFGPAPYGLRLLNALLFTSGAAILFRLVRPAFGAIPAFAGLVVVLVLPSVFYASVSLLKESLYFLASATLLAAVVLAIRSRAWPAIAAALALGAASAWVLDDLRRGAILLASAGIGCGLALRLVVGYRWRATAVAGALLLAAVTAVTQPAVGQRVLDGLVSMAKTHTGHVFTVGHSYRLLDDGFYMNPVTPMASTIVLTPPQAARFVLRSIGSFIATPLPWQVASLGEFAFIPEHMLWYLLLAMLPIGLVAGWRRDALVTAVLIGFVLPTAAALAFTNGNVGTLLRLRGLVTPYITWISVLGVCAVANAVAAGTISLPLRRPWKLGPQEGVA